MNRILSVITALLLLACLTACGSSGSSHSAGNNTFTKTRTSQAASNAPVVNAKPQKCSDLPGAPVTTQNAVEKVCGNDWDTDNSFGCYIGGKAAGMVVYIESRKKLYIGRTGKTYKKYDAPSNPTFTQLAKLAGCDAS